METELYLKHIISYFPAEAHDKNVSLDERMKNQLPPVSVKDNLPVTNEGML